MIFTLYTAPSEDILVKDSLDFMLYTQLYIACKNPSSVIGNLENCIDKIRSCMRDNLHRLNSSNTEVMFFSSCYSERSKSEQPSVFLALVNQLSMSSLPLKI